MRLDRMLTLGLGCPLERLGVLPANEVPILMYHRISDQAETLAPYYKLNTSPARFDQQLRLLNQLGFRSVSLDVALTSHGQLGPDLKPVVITFDDGFRDFYDQAFPILKKHGHTATMFLPTSFIAEKRRTFKDQDCLTWREVRELRANGMQFGSHTVTHPRLYQLSWKEIEAELAISKETIEQELGEEAGSFAYPYAFPQEDRSFARTFRDILCGQKYRNCVTTVVGRVRQGDDPFCVKRLPVNNCDDQLLLEAKLKGAYDWIGYPQKWSRKIRRWTGRSLRKAPATHPLANGLPAEQSTQNSTL